MKNIIVTIAEILLGVAIFTLIFGPSGSLKSESIRIFQDSVTQMQTIKP